MVKLWPVSNFLSKVRARKLRYILSVTSGNENLAKSLCLLMTLPSDTYFKKGVNILVFIEHMQRNLILTDVMKTGDHVQLEKFIQMHSLANQQFDCTGDYYNLHNYDLDSYDRKFAIIDTSYKNKKLQTNKVFIQDLRARCDLLHSQGFVFIKATPWESLENIENTDPAPHIEIDHVKWSGGVSWFWFYMFNKHRDNAFNIDHSNKKHEFLYLNKFPRPHRVTLYEKLQNEKLLDKSIYTFRMLEDPVILEQKYELPGVDTRMYPRFGKDQDMTEAPYVDTACSLVSETNVNDTDVFMTEKIWKPIIAQHVFVVHGNYLYLQKLREMGFKTFNTYFDESYDLERDSQKRIDKIVQLTKDLKKLKWSDIYLQSQSMRLHNYNNFFNREKLSEQIDKTLLTFLEFADSR